MSLKQLSLGPRMPLTVESVSVRTWSDRLRLYALREADLWVGGVGLGRHPYSRPMIWAMIAINVRAGEK
jgi:hypothetical protein